MTLADIIKRVEGATGPDTKLDVAILRSLADGVDASITYLPITASVDVVIYLIGEKMPGWGWRVEHAQDRVRAVGTMMGPTKNDKEWSHHEHGAAPTPAIALLLAFLRAWEAKGDA